ncbi:MAG: response regulator [Betaproteobacteria bacterium]|nr:response regulator [Betaproteobacteria bacterium]
MVSKHILIVDDDRVILTILAEGLRDLGYEVSTAVTGAAALELVKHNAPDLAVLDMRMPEMSGIEVALALNEMGRVPFVFLSAFGDDRVVREAAEAGALGYLVKPVDIPQLVPFIEAAMARGLEIDRLRATAEQLEQALRIEQKTRTAVGIIMERKGLDRQEAFDLLRARARSRRRKIAEVADELITAVEDMNQTLRAP